MGACCFGLGEQSQLHAAVRKAGKAGSSREPNIPRSWRPCSAGRPSLPQGAILACLLTRREDITDDGLATWCAVTGTQHDVSPNPPLSRAVSPLTCLALAGCIPFFEEAYTTGVKLTPGIQSGPGE